MNIPTITTFDPKVEVHRTPGGKLAVKATSGELSKTSYFVGGYHYYVISARRFERSYNHKTGDYEDAPEIRIHVHKRTGNRDVARRVANLVGATIFARYADGSYAEVSV